MRSTFMSFELGKKSILAHQYALDITGHNVANANTPGYTRQEPVFQTTTPFCAPQMSQVSVGQFGTGVTMDEIRRLRDEFIDLQFRHEQKTLGMWSTKKDALYKLEGILNEPTGNSMRGVLDRFWEGLQNLSKNPETDSVRSTVYENGQSLVDAFHHIYKQLAELRDDLNTSVQIKVSEINSLARQIADLNGQIQAVKIAGKQPNDLLDRRDLLIDQLTKIVDVQVIPDRNLMATVIVGGRALVQDIKAAAMTVTPDFNNIYKIVWEDSPTLEVSIESGELKGILDARGVNSLYWDLHETNITRVLNHFDEKILNYKIDTRTANDDAPANAAMNRLYEYSQYAGDLIPGGGAMTYNLSRTDLNGQILLEVVSKDAANNLQIRYSVDMVDRVGNHYVNTGNVNVAAWAGGGDMVLSNLDLDGMGVQTLDLDITNLLSGSSAFNSGDKFVLGMTAERVAGMDSNDGLVLHNMDTTSSGKAQQLQYWFDEGTLEDRKLILGSFALNEASGEVLRNSGFELTFGTGLKDGQAALVNRTGLTLREVYSRDLVDPYTGIIPQALDRINNLARVVIMEMNAQHRKGYNLNEFPDNTNIDFFKDFGNVPPDFQWAEKIEISDAVKSDLKNIAAAGGPTRDSLGNRINFGDGSNALLMAQVKQKFIAGLGGATMDDYWRATVSQTGVAAQQANRMASNQETLVAQIDSKRQALSGVSLDEEMVNMIRFQHAYNAAARYITTIDETIDVIINRLGIVGR